jgi:hypothetical protein
MIGVAIPPPLAGAVLSATVEDANKNGRVDPGETDPNRYDPAALPHLPLLLLDDDS